MKGAYQNPDRQLYEAVISKIFANSPFGFDSGGKPSDIVKLSYE
jgi:Zn-dependent M16 (insulinase) family peptidase